MKQAEDLFTQELPELGDSLTTQGVNSTHTLNTPSKFRFRFYVVTADDNGGEHCTEWRGLTNKQARDMYAYTQQSNPWNVIRCGWEEVK